MKCTFAQYDHLKTNTAESIAAAKDFTVIDDGQFMFPVKSVDLANWTSETGDLEDTDLYNKFCNDVPFFGNDLGSVGSQPVIDFCTALIENGAEVLHLS